MRTKSISAFFLGLIGIIVEAVSIYFSFVVTILVAAFSNLNVPDNLILLMLALLVIGTLLALISLVFCFFNTKVACCLFATAFILTISYPIFLSIIFSNVSLNLVPLFIAPPIFLLSALRCARAYKKQKNKATENV